MLTYKIKGGETITVPEDSQLLKSLKTAKLVSDNIWNADKPVAAIPKPKQ